MEYITLNTGFQMPIVGFGTAYLPKVNYQSIITTALNDGYRMFDTAWSYGNETDLGEALKNNRCKREEVFITTKISAAQIYYNTFREGKRAIFNLRKFKPIKKIIREAFERLDTEYIDLFLVHWPAGGVKHLGSLEIGTPIYLKIYEELTKYYHKGKIRSIGVSSFTEGHIESLKEVSDVIPAVNQIEISPLNTQKNLIQFCRDRGIAVEAMSTFSHYKSNEPRLEIFNHDILKGIALKHNKTVAQIVLRWLIQQNIIVIPKSKSSIHIKENIDIFDFSLSQEEMHEIDALDQGKCLNYNPYTNIVIKNIPLKYRALSLRNN